MFAENDPPRVSPRILDINREGRGWKGLPGLISIEHSRVYTVHISAGTNEEKDDKEKGLEFEDAEHDLVRLFPSEAFWSFASLSGIGIFEIRRGTRYLILS